MALWFLLSIGLIVFLITSPGSFAQPQPGGLRLGTDLHMQLLLDPGGRMTAEEVAALSDEAFTTLNSPVNEGYTRDVHWLRVAPPAPGSQASAWLEVLPTYLDRVTLYQQTGDAWQEHNAGDTVAADAGAMRVRPLVFTLAAGRPFLLRVQTTSPMQVDATLWPAAGLMSHIGTTEWASGVHQGINLMHALLIIGAALALRMRSLVALATASVATLLHGAADRGYLLLWLPAQFSHWSNVLVSVGTLALPVALAWQFREVLTKNARWRRADRLLLALGLVPLLCLPALPLGRYSDWAWVGIGAPWAISMVVAWVAWSNLRREGPTLENLLMVLPSTAYGLAGLYVTAAYMGAAPVPQMETSILWQLNTLLVNIVVTVAVGARLVQRFRSSVAQLAQSQQHLDEQVRVRTAELLQTHNDLQAALDSERGIREEQRHFFDMVNHEFRTPLMVMDSAATEQQAFPSPDLDAQVERATQIRRICRRMVDLVDNCLASERLHAASLQLRRQDTDLDELLEHAAELVQWSPRHRLELANHGPARWSCDPTLIRIALSNLADNAVKYAQPGVVRIAARLGERGDLQVSVCDEGPGLSAHAVEQLFERGGQGPHQTRGFGLGLWAARRIARLHGGDVQAAPSARGGTCFTLSLPASPTLPG
ncbi:sensor histidine kinase [Pulveribacter suum]|uniref:sensor histidine kinase n=1 Tax=Pulveribacter suum TaxID=2116657 RepID=UPI001D040848|nr:7TM-DISM domain-containing protein [Pulveribacter suum]